MTGILAENVNYDINVTHNETILDKKNVYDKDGKINYTIPLSKPVSESAEVIIKVKFNGIGEEIPFEYPSEKTITMRIVPEFGTMSVVILTLAIISIIIISAKSRLNFMPRV